MTAFAASMTSLASNVMAGAVDLFDAISPVLGIVFAAAMVGFVLNALRRFLP